MLASFILMLALLAGLGPDRCFIQVLITSRPTSGMLVVARSLPDTVPVPTTPDDLIHVRPSTDEILRNYVPVAQRFEAIAVSGTGLDIEPGSPFLVVPWGYHADCSSTPWTESAQWVAPGQEVLFRFAPTRTTRYEQPVVDVLGWHAPYPTAALWEFEGHGRPIRDRREWLTAREYYELILELPTDQASEVNRRAAAEIVEQIFRRTERLGSVFPGTAIHDLYRLDRTRR